MLTNSCYNVNMRSKIKEFFVKYESKIILILGFILVAGLSFEAGIMKGRDFQEKPLVIEKTAAVHPDGVKKSSDTPKAPDLTPDSSASLETGNTTPQNCAYVGSKNSNKYHLPTCRWAKQIKPENRVCFSSEDEAKSRGYLPDKNCIK